MVIRIPFNAIHIIYNNSNYINFIIITAMKNFDVILKFVIESFFLKIFAIY